MCVVRNYCHHVECEQKLLKHSSSIFEIREGVVPDCNIVLLFCFHGRKCKRERERERERETLTDRDLGVREGT